MKKLYIITISIITISIAFFAYNFFTQTKIQETDAALSRTGLVGHWDMDSESINGTTVYDKSGQGNHGTSANTPTVVAGKIGQAMSFNGATDEIDITSVQGLTDNYSMSAWFYVNSFGDANYIFSRGTSLAYDAFGIYLNKLILYNGATIISSNTTINSKIWYHAVATRSGSTVTYYLNGINDGGGTSAPAFSGNAMKIGDKSDGGVNWNGLMDDLRIYNYALSAQEIANLYNSAKSNYTQAPQRNGLVGHWNMDSESINGMIVYDKSGNNYNGTFSVTPVIVAGKIGQALDGSAGQSLSIVDTNEAFMPKTKDFTWSIWIKPNIADLGRGIISKGMTAVGGLYLYLHSGNFYQIYGDNGTINIGGPVPNYGKWSLITLTRSGSTMNMYINGEYVAQDTSSGADLSLASSLIISSSGIFASLIDDARIYNYALSAQEVSALYSSAKTNYTQAPSRTGLVGYWNMDSTEIFGTNVYDTSGQNNHGTSANTPTLLAGKIGQAMSFNDSTDYINIGSAGATLTDNFTLSAWVKHSADTVNDGDRIIARRNNEDGTQFDFYIQNSNHRLSLFTGVVYDGNNNSITDEQWNFVTVVINGANSRFYVNGVADAGAFNPTITAKSLNTLIGAGFDGASTTIFNGSIDDVRIYNYALSAKEVADLYSYTNSYIR